MPHPVPARRPIAVLAAAVSLWTMTVTPPAGAAEASEDFAVTDRNSDGFVDRGEFHQRMVELFFFADGDRDGRLVPAELPRVDKGVFSGADRNGDGALSLTEFTEARAVDFGQADTDGDGLLSRAEVEAGSGGTPGSARK